jgi:hypothetical protein
MKIKLKKITYPKLRLNNEIKNKLKFHKRTKKIKNHKNKDLSGNTHKSKDDSKILHGKHKFHMEERERREKKCNQ